MRSRCLQGWSGALLCSSAHLDLGIAQGEDVGSLAQTFWNYLGVDVSLQSRNQQHFAHRAQHLPLALANHLLLRLASPPKCSGVPSPSTCRGNPAELGAPSALEGASPTATP